MVPTILLSYYLPQRVKVNLVDRVSLSLYVAYIQRYNKQISTSETDELFPYFITVFGGRGWVTR